MNIQTAYWQSMAWLGYVALSSAACASGIYLDVQNGVGTGNAFAGAAASAADASTVFFNPAGMSTLAPGQWISGAVSAVRIDSTFHDNGSTPLSPLAPLGADESHIHRPAVVPAVYYVTSLPHDLHLGMGISPLYGNKDSWPGDFVGRYQGSRTDLHAINYNPSLSLQFNEQWSFGVGIDYLDIDAELGRKVPITADGAYVTDGDLIVKGSDAAWGFNAGLLYLFNDTTTLGLSYRSGTTLDIEGDAIRSTSAQSRIVLPGEARIKVPEIVSLAVACQRGRWEWLGDLTWSGWSAVPGIFVTSRDTGFELFSETLNFRDGWRVGTGTNFQYSDTLTFRAGVAFDRSVVPDPGSRTVRFPDGNRKWLGLGASYAFTPATSVDAGVAHIFVSDTTIDRKTEYAVPTPQVLRGDISTDGNIVSLQVNHRL